MGPEAHAAKGDAEERAGGVSVVEEEDGSVDVARA